MTEGSWGWRLQPPRARAPLPAHRPHAQVAMQAARGCGVAGFAAAGFVTDVLGASGRRRTADFCAGPRQTLSVHHPTPHCLQGRRRVQRTAAVHAGPAAGGLQAVAAAPERGGRELGGRSSRPAAGAAPPPLAFCQGFAADTACVGVPIGLLSADDGRAGLPELGAAPAGMPRPAACVSHPTHQQHCPPAYCFQRCILPLPLAAHPLAGAQHLGRTQRGGGGRTAAAAG